MNRFQLSAAALAALLALPATAADPVSNSYLEAGWLNTSLELDTASDDVEGFHLNLSVGFSPYVAAIVEFDQRRYDDSREAVGSAGLVLHTLNPVLQPYLAATWEQIQTDDNTAPENDNTQEGWGAELGLRWALPNLELRGFVKHADYGEAELLAGDFDLTSLRYGVLAAAQLSPKWALTGQWRTTTFTFDGSGGEVEADVEDYILGLRRYFATDADRRKRKGGLLTGFGSDDEAVAE